MPTAITAEQDVTYVDAGGAHPKLTSAADRRLSIRERRIEEVVSAAVTVFAARGLHAPTAEIARASGISHAYLFRLFPTKLELVLAVSAHVRTRLARCIAAVRPPATGDDEGDVRSQMQRAWAQVAVAEPELVRLTLLLAGAATTQQELRADQRHTMRTLSEGWPGNGPDAADAGPDTTADLCFLAHGLAAAAMSVLTVDEPIGPGRPPG